MKRWVAFEQLLNILRARVRKSQINHYIKERFRMCIRGSFLISWPKFLGDWKILPRVTSESSPLEMFLSKNKQNSFSTFLPKNKDINHYMMSQVHCGPSLIIPLTSFPTRNILDPRSKSYSTYSPITLS